MADQIMIRPNPFFPSKIRAGAAYQRRYGDSILRIYGKPLTERDRGTMIVLLDLSKRNGNRPFDFRLSDIAKAQGARNPYDRKVLDPIYESIDRLLDIQIRIRPTKEIGLTAKFVLLEGYASRSGTGSIAMGQYLGIIHDLALGCTYIQPENYFAVRSQIGRALYVFLASQQKFYKGEGYQIRLSLLLQHINYINDGRSWFQVWPVVEDAIRELKELGLIGRYQRDRERYPKDGGVVKFWPGKKELPEAATPRPQALLDKAVELCQCPPDEGMTGYIEGLAEYSRNFAAANGDRVRGADLGMWFMDYLRNQMEKGWLKQLHPRSFSLEGRLFHKFMKEYVADRLEFHNENRGRIIVDRAELDRKIAEQAATTRRRDERVKKIQKAHPLLDDRECPFGHQRGDDFGNTQDCHDCGLAYEGTHQKCSHAKAFLNAGMF